ncbi:hypothetical protein LPB140_11060 [Sphingorhabdus lutea]|uniref:NlpC/P60 domain-containing protein n=1 Tax=Sphingorhabdus lutea TaxID=1913578 RepID=A0A1L3JDM6_9SPHN|nr:hypothetical protein [Sphingorhabdus lutea]APG63235.1 hypothetical protein LPB140_11060 [Sphingorhabdus lutea]
MQNCLCRAKLFSAAQKYIGTSFKLWGRSADTGLDCVGTLSLSLQNIGFVGDIPIGYSLRQRSNKRISDFFTRPEFCPINIDSAYHVAGNIIMVRPDARQVHFAITAGRGLSAIHAYHAVQSVVCAPMPDNWPISGAWKYCACPTSSGQ